MTALEIYLDLARRQHIKLNLRRTTWAADAYRSEKKTRKEKKKQSSIPRGTSPPKYAAPEPNSHFLDRICHHHHHHHHHHHVVAAGAC